MLHNDNWLQSNLKFYNNGIELSIIVSFSYLDLVFIPGVFFSSAQSKVHLQFNINIYAQKVFV